MKVYVAGPMTGIANFNYPAFHAASAGLREQGHEVFSPAERDMERDGKDWGAEQTDGDLQAAKAKGFNRRKALGDDLAWICAEADAIAMLPGWEKSSGARAEKSAAEALGLDVILL